MPPRSSRSKDQRFKLIGGHPEDLADGRVLVPGTYTDLTVEQQEDEHNKRLIDEGLLIPAGDPQETPDDPPPPPPGEGDQGQPGNGDNGGNS
jgi:hypothetical protein